MGTKHTEGEKRRDFIIGSLYRFGDTQALDLQRPRRKTLNEMLSLGVEAIEQNRQSELVDLNKVALELRQRLSHWTHTPVLRAVALMRTLEQLSVNERALLGLSIVYSWTTLELTQIAWGGLRALKEACVQAEPSRAAQAISKLEQLMSFLPVITVERLSPSVLFVSTVGYNETRRALRDFRERVDAGFIEKGVERMVLFSPEESATCKAAWEEYLSRCLEGEKTVSPRAILLTSSLQYEGNDMFHWLKHWVGKAFLSEKKHTLGGRPSQAA